MIVPWESADPDADQEADQDEAETTESAADTEATGDEEAVDDDAADSETTMTTAPGAAPLEPIAPAASCVGDPVGDGAHSPRTDLYDIDGDGADDEVITYYYPTNAMWHLRTALASGAVLDQPISESTRDHRALPLGVRDVDGDGRPELFVHTGSNGSIDTVGIYVMAGCGPTRVLSEAGTPAVLEVGVDELRLAGLSCEGTSDLDVFAGDRFETSDFDGRLVAHDLVGRVLTARTGRQPAFTASQLDRSARLNCPPVRARS